VIVQVSGPPCAGKSTYIKENANPYDVILDDNTLLGARYGRARVPDRAWRAWHHHLDIVLAVWQLTDPRTLWYIQGNPAPRTARARVVLLTPPYSELIRRVAADERPTITSKWIRDWFNKYGNYKTS